LAISPDSMVPTVRLMLRIGVSMTTFSRRSSAGCASSNQPVVERLVEAVVLRFAVVLFDFGRHLRQVKDPREIQPLRLPVRDALARVEQVGAADQS
jgi:hypothetical protein